MITPKPKTVVELFEGHPERWYKSQEEMGGAWKNAMMTTPCCIFGACQIVYGDFKTELCTNILDKLQNSLGLNSRSELFKWNDAPETTFEEVLAKCKELNI